MTTKISGVSFQLAFFHLQILWQAGCLPHFGKQDAYPTLKTLYGLFKSANLNADWFKVGIDFNGLAVPK